MEKMASPPIPRSLDQHATLPSPAIIQPEDNNHNYNNDQKHGVNDDTELANAKRKTNDGEEDDISSLFWNTNLPSSQHTKDCPSFLQYALTNDKDRAILSTRDADYRRHTWWDLRDIARERRLDLLKRVPSDLRRYREFTAKIEREYGSVMAFVVKERLGWEKEVFGGTANATSEKGEGLFDDPETYCILINDWPYGIDERVVHLVVWTKHAFATSPVSAENPHGDLTPAARCAINTFVAETFTRECGSQNVLWFWNWSSLKSVLAVEHFHVMLFAPPEGFVDRVVTKRDRTGG